MSQVSRRSLLQLMGATAMATGVLGGTTLAAFADDSELVIGGSLPLTGVFGFAGVAVEKAMQDYVKIINDKGGIAGRKLRLAYEDTAYKPDTSVAVFNKLTSQNDIHLYYGDSTAFAKTISPELARADRILMGGASFATELNDPEKHPNIFIPGPDYSEMFSILLEHIAKEKPGAKVIFVCSDSEFGRDPIEPGTARAKALGLDVGEVIITPPGSVDVSTEVLKLRRARPDYVIFHGYIKAPLPEFMSQAKQLGLETKFMGTFWSMDSSIWDDVGEVADGFMGIMPYRYYYDTEPAPMLETIRQMRPDYQATGYMQGMISMMILVESAKRVLEAGQELTGKNLKAAMNTIKDFDTGGIIGVPFSMTGNSIPVGRVYQYSAAEKKMNPVSDWINVGA
ncbi:ABC transporter substrate-binding protein [Falsigemmobacter intermedius]|uniref:Amino acid ABC transporter substrate-binding protein n=1 Tax=Falsigemmobacter intermedius TaxID=1553448 RepID=A0A3S4Y165_9RHOB|nr:ABC transporter substrate-binding protein [Falsigemmobacter intermedius]RWY45483.1 amino acid ABC transporter substrate-binding protein [Falsigemmobacter intermedius]